MLLARLVKERRGVGVVGSGQSEVGSDGVDEILLCSGGSGSLTTGCRREGTIPPFPTQESSVGLETNSY